MEVAPHAALQQGKRPKALTFILTPNGHYLGTPSISATHRSPIRVPYLGFRLIQMSSRTGRGVCVGEDRWENSDLVRAGWAFCPTASFHLPTTTSSLYGLAFDNAMLLALRQGKRYLNRGVIVVVFVTTLECHIDAGPTGLYPKYLDLDFDSQQRCVSRLRNAASTSAPSPRCSPPSLLEVNSSRSPRPTWYQHPNLLIHRHLAHAHVSNWYPPHIDTPDGPPEASLETLHPPPSATSPVPAPAGRITHRPAEAHLPAPVACLILSGLLLPPSAAARGCPLRA
ncbi:hypothetical protein C8R44DRAFT_877758 [Mycena epipterygia]|nr:hypothetical protein C8R44DRAFT_877758 [Mycena epipterygia]